MAVEVFWPSEDLVLPYMYKRKLSSSDLLLHQLARLNNDGQSEKQRKSVCDYQILDA
jgi:hypothetical protein